jgi:hypothetical protein
MADEHDDWMTALGVDVGQLRQSLGGDASPPDDAADSSSGAGTPESGAAGPADNVAASPGDDGTGGGDNSAQSGGDLGGAAVPAGCANAWPTLVFIIDDKGIRAAGTCEYFKQGATMSFVNVGTVRRHVRLTNGIASDADLFVETGGDKVSTSVSGPSGQGGSVMVDGVNGGDRTVVDIVICPA